MVIEEDPDEEEVAANEVEVAGKVLSEDCTP